MDVLGGGQVMSREEHPADFEDFVRKVYSPLYRKAWLLCGDRHESEDLVQEALFKIYRRWWTLQRREDLIGYAHTVLVRTFVSERRRLRWRFEQLWAQPPDSIAPADQATEDAVALSAALALLAPRQRAVVVLRFWEDLSVSQVAAILACSSGTVTSQTTRALRTLRGAWAEPW